MHGISRFFIFSTLAVTLTGGTVFAQHYDNRRDDHRNNRQDNRRDNHYDNHRYVHHQNWRRGARMDRNDWNRGQRIDYRRYRLNAPRRGYEWREVDGNYVMAAIATGLIASVIVASTAH
jgi:Ni/Co efflux regulator RcnB